MTYVVTAHANLSCQPWQPCSRSYHNDKALPSWQLGRLIHCVVPPPSTRYFSGLTIAITMHWRLDRDKTDRDGAAGQAGYGPCSRS